MSADRGNTVGLIGLGLMGSAMGANLVRAGFEVVGTDLRAERRAEFDRAGGVAVQDARAVGARCRRVVLSLPSDASLGTVCQALVESCVAGAIVIETSTLSLTAKQDCRQALAAREVILLDCPISGTAAQARTRDLSVYASGDARAIDAVQPVMEGFARACHNVGAFGNGTRMKLVANLLVAIHNVAAAEAVLLGTRLGLDPKQVVDVVSDGAGASRMLQIRGPVMVRRAWDPPAMKNSVWQKDMELILDALSEAGCPAPLFSATWPVYQAALAGGHADHDTAAVFDVLEHMEPVHKER